MEQPNLDELADALAALSEKEAEAVIAKARTKDTKTRQQAAAQALRGYLGVRSQ